ncbi:MAG: LytTR family DNA-binding domain-containing protein [Bacteroidota bacterium]
MKRTQRYTVYFIGFILAIIVFDALQQKYYVDTFILAAEGKTISLWLLIKNHLVKWAIWALVMFPFAHLARKVLARYHHSTEFNTLSLLMVSILGFSAVAIFFASIVSILLESEPFQWSVVSEVFIFNIFQKGLVFSLASGTIVLIIRNQLKEGKIVAQSSEIQSLKESSAHLEKALRSTDEPHLHIKTGNRINKVALSEISWIQADDYCVRVHAQNQIFTLRKSLKALEKELAPHRFVRVHRGALLNLDFVDQINLESSTIKLLDTSELPISKAGAQSLKKRLKEASI